MFQDELKVKVLHNLLSKYFNNIKILEVDTINYKPLCFCLITLKNDISKSGICF